jgi:hypothetical protein
MNTTDLTIELFETSQVPAEAFTHEGHVYMGWLYTREFGTKHAGRRFDEALHRLVQKLGAETKYNGMITWLFMKLIAERTQEGEEWADFRARNADLIDDRPRSGA